MEYMHHKRKGNYPWEGRGRKKMSKKDQQGGEERWGRGQERKHNDNIHMETS